MSDIVERLRERPSRYASETEEQAKERRQREREKGADTITTLRADNERLRAALQHISNLSPTEPHAMQITARRALTQEKPND